MCFFVSHATQLTLFSWTLPSFGPRPPPLERSGGGGVAGGDGFGAGIGGVGGGGGDTWAWADNREAAVDHIARDQGAGGKLSEFTSDLPCVKDGTCPLPAFRCPK